MGVLPDVDIAIKDGGLGRVGSASDVLGAVGVGSVAQSNVIILSSFEDFRTKVGDGPLRDFLEGVYSQVNVSCYVRVLPGTTAGTLSSVTAGSGNVGVGSLRVAGEPANCYSFEIEIESDDGLNTATFRIKKNGLRGKEITVPQSGSYTIPNTGVTLTFSAGTPTGSQASFKKEISLVLQQPAPVQPMANF